MPQVKKLARPLKLDFSHRLDDSFLCNVNQTVTHRERAVHALSKSITGPTSPALVKAGNVLAEASRTSVAQRLS